jgi:four helix bundle protein
MEGGLQELEETAYWLELLAESKAVSAKRLTPLMDETNHLVAMFAASINTAKPNRRK